MTYRMLLLFLSGLALAGCGGVDDDPDDPIDTSTTASCLQDTWSRTLQGSSGHVDLTYEFLEDGTYIQRSYVDNISTAEYLGGVRNTDLDLPVLPGLSVDVGTALGILGPLYLEGYFHVEGTWAVDEESGIITTILPDTKFGHSIWSASGAESDFNRSVPDLSQVATETIEQYVYCTNSQLVVGAYYKQDDSDIAGLWDNLDNEFYVAEDYVGATQRFRAESDNRVYASNSFAMALTSDGYALRRCAQQGAYRGGLDSELFWIEPQGTLTPAGLKLPSRRPPEIPISEPYEVLTSDYLYRIEEGDGALTRMSLLDGKVTEVYDFGPDVDVRRSLVTAQGVLIEMSLDYGRDGYLAYISEPAAEVVTHPVVPRDTYYRLYNDEVVIADNAADRVYFYEPVSGEYTEIPFAGGYGDPDGTLYLSSIEDELVVQSNTATADGTNSRFWVYSDASEQFEVIAELDSSGSYNRIIAGNDGYDVAGRDESGLHVLVYLSAEQGFEATNTEVVAAGSYEAKGDASSRYFLREADAGVTRLYLLDITTGERSLLTPSGFSVLSADMNVDGSRVIATATDAGGKEYQLVIDLAADGSVVNTDYIERGDIGQEGIGHSGDVSAFYLQRRMATGEKVSTLYQVSQNGGGIQTVSDQYSFGDSDAAFGDDFITTSDALIAPARDEYSHREMLVYNRQTDTFDFHDLNPVPDVSSSPRLIGTLGSRALIQAWPLESSCYDPEGLLRFEENYLWYESDTKGFRGTQWFNR